MKWHRMLCLIGIHRWGSDWALLDEIRLFSGGIGVCHMLRWCEDCGKEKRERVQ